MKKVLPSILITVIALANILAPISVGWEEKKIEITKNEVKAEADGGIKMYITPSHTDKTITIKVNILFETTDILTIQGAKIILTDTTGKNPPSPIETVFNIDGDEITKTIPFNKLTPETLYTITVESRQISALDISYINLETLWEDNFSESKPGSFVIKKIITVTTSKKDETKIITENKVAVANQFWDDLPSCNPLTGKGLIGCLAQGIYYILFVPSSFLFAVSGTFFDWTFNYSVQSSSYKSQFVVQGWNIVRDFCNMFFIFILLYIAFKTILDLNGAKTKEMIINVIIIGLLINFSLFATQVIIDTSNILARVFYNSNTIKITAIDNDLNIPNMIKRPSETGIIPLSEALVNKVNPQALILNAGDFGNISGISNDVKKDGVGIGTFIIVTLLASGISIVGFIVFLTVGLLFITRVVGLWLAMILAPLAFFSYTVPAMQDWGMVGWKNWWPETLKLAFLAPVFIFFIYLILQFLEVGLGVLDAQGKGVLGYLLSILMPFAFIMVLLMKAKGVAVKLSGQMGESVSKAGSAIGGLTLGAVTGGAAMAMRGTIGKYAGNVANSDKLKADAEAGGFKGWQAKQRLKMASGVSKSTFDARNTVLGKEAQKGLGVDMTKGPKFIKPAEGGYAGAQERKAKKIEEMDKLTKASASTANKQDTDAKKWNDKYSEDMINTKNKALADGEVFDENKFRKEYENGKAQIVGKDGKTTEGGTARVLNSNEIEKQRMSDKASKLEYGDDYIEKRNKAKNDQGADFNESKWSKDELEKGTLKRRANLTEGDEKLIQEYKKQGTVEKAPLNAIEKDRAEKTKEKAEKTLSKADEELEKITEELKKIADSKGIKEGVEGVKKEHIMTELIQPKQEKIIEHNNIILQATSAINKDPYNKKAIKDLTAAQKAKKRLEDEIDDAKSLLANKEKYENVINQQTETIKQQDDKLLNR